MPAFDDRSANAANRLAVQPAALVLIVATLVGSWLAMMIVHEFGHVLLAWCSGGTVTKVVLHPLAISRTDVSPNPHPLIEIWGGPIVGCLLPLIAAFFTHRMRLSDWPVVRFFAGFCLIANGAYIGVGVWDPVGDALELAKLGTPAWMLALFGVATISTGLWFWHGLGRHFGIGKDRLPVKWSRAFAMSIFVGVIIVLECALSDRM